MMAQCTEIIPWLYIGAAMLRDVPLDLETVVHSVNKTGRCVIVHEAPCTSL
jgi:hypothetical protein